MWRWEGIGVGSTWGRGSPGRHRLHHPTGRAKHSHRWPRGHAHHWTRSRAIGRPSPHHWHPSAHGPSHWDRGATHHHHPPRRSTPHVPPWAHHHWATHHLKVVHLGLCQHPVERLFKVCVEVAHVGLVLVASVVLLTHRRLGIKNRGHIFEIHAAMHGVEMT